MSHEMHRYHADPSGTFVRYNAKAIGSGSEGAQQELENSWHKVCPRSALQMLMLTINHDSH